MPTFETPPDWWISLANLTDWFEWPAIAAVLTFLVLVNTVRLADRANREARHRDATYLHGVATILIKTCAAFESSSDRDKKTADNDNLKALIEVWEDSEMFEQYGSVDPKNLPTADTFQAYLNGKLAIAAMRYHVRAAVKSGRPIEEGAFRMEQSAREAADTMSAEVRRRRGRGVASHLQALIRSLKPLPTWTRATWNRLFSRKPAETQ